MLLAIMMSRSSQHVEKLVTLHQWYGGQNGLDLVPESLRGLITSTHDLDGRHSDYVMPVCQVEQSEPHTKTEEKYGFVGPFDYLPEYKNPCWLQKGTHTIKCVPYVYLIGAPKAGTSDLFVKLRTHPQILPGLEKEFRWFAAYRHKDPRKSDISYFVKFFATASQSVQKSLADKTNTAPYHQKVIADGDPHYFFKSVYWQVVPGNEGCHEPRVTIISQLHHLWPRAKLLLILRQPTTRLYSAYLYGAVINNTNRTKAQFHELVQIALTTWHKCLEEHSFRFCIYAEHIRADRLGAMVAGAYSRYILDILRVFPRDQLHVVRTEDYSHHMVETLKGIHRFLDLQALPDNKIPNATQAEARNKGSSYEIAGNMWEKTRQLLDAFYAPFNRELADIFNDKKFLWLDTKVKVSQDD